MYDKASKIVSLEEMKKIMFIALAFMFFALNANAKKNEIVGYDYELVTVKGGGGATSGFRIFKVWSYCKKKELLTQEICMRNAVHGILFKGLAGADDEGGNLNALVPEGYDSNAEYFNNFFSSGDYQQYIQLTSKGAQQAGDVIKTSKKEWKVGLLVQINYKALRKRLEKDGIIQSTNDIFRRQN